MGSTAASYSRIPFSDLDLENCCSEVTREANTGGQDYLKVGLDLFVPHIFVIH